MKSPRTILLGACAILLIGCGKPHGGASKKATESRFPSLSITRFHPRQFGWSDLDRIRPDILLKLISNEECELSEGGTIVLGKYTETAEGLRVVLTIHRETPTLRSLIAAAQLMFDLH
jgi:hypothetical protein